MNTDEHGSGAQEKPGIRSAEFMPLQRGTASCLEQIGARELSALKPPEIRTHVAVAAAWSIHITVPEHFEGAGKILQHGDAAVAKMRREFSLQASAPFAFSALGILGNCIPAARRRSIPQLNQLRFRPHGHA